MTKTAEATSTLRAHRALGMLLVYLLVFWCLPSHAQYSAADFKKNPFLLGVPIDLDVPEHPAAFQGTDRLFHLVYELHLTNYSKADLALKQLEVIDDSTDKVLTKYSNSELRGRLRVLGGKNATSILPGGTMGVLFIWLDFTNAVAPQALRHRLQVAAPAFPRYGVQATEGEATRVDREARVIGPPLRGGDWWAANGPSNHSGHRRTLIVVNGKARIAQRYATDWARLQNGELLKGHPSMNSSYFSYGAEVLAVADGTVVSVLDSLPENRAQTYPEMTLANMGGNNIILDIGQHQFAFYAHLQSHSIRVSVGDHVVRGQVLALVGNSGNATGPHLHFQLSDANSELATEGQPFVIDSMELIGRFHGEDFKSFPHSELLNNVLPLEDDVIRFP